MAGIPELPEPGVEVLQEFVSTSPVITVPALIPCIVGVCKEIRELYATDGTLNSDITVIGPAIARATLAEASYTSMAGLTLQVRVNGGVTQEFTMPATAGTMTAAEVAVAITGHSPAPVDFGAYVAEEEISGTTYKYLELRSTANGADRTIQIVGGTAHLTKFGYGTGFIN
ncbi:MAG: hypothetical protein ACXAEU_25465 [Candidatus Hodarchaeales archaeon]|jgi:hypothetical protein